MGLPKPQTQLPFLDLCPFLKLTPKDGEYGNGEMLEEGYSSQSEKYAFFLQTSQTG